ncbi:MAG: tetratricopeptide repeat protein [Acidiferrobacter sp.]
MPIAQTRSRDLIDRLNDMRRGLVNEIALRAIQNEAEAIKATDALGAYTVLGGVACLRGDMEAMHEAHQKALRLAPRDIVANINYASSLLYSGLIGDALEWFRRTYVLAPHDPIVLNVLIETLKGVGRYREAQQLLPEWEHLNPQQPRSDTDLIQEGSRFLDTMSISDNEQQDVAQEIVATLARYGKRGAGETTPIMQEDKLGDPWLERLVRISHASPEEVVNLNEASAEKIVAMPNESIREHIIVRYTSSAPDGY